MTVALIGGTGFLGSHVANLLSEGEVVAVTRPTSDTTRLPSTMRSVAADLTDLDAVVHALLGVDTLVYCASMGFGHVPPLVSRLRQTSVRRAVFVSTTAIFTTLPAPAKSVRIAAETAVQQSDLEWTILRPTMIYGTGRDRNVARLLRFLRRSPIYPVFGDGRALHQPVHVDDLAAGVVATISRPSSVRREYNLAGAEPLPYRELVQAAAAALGKNVRLVHVPLSAALAAATLATAIPLPRFVTPEQIRRLAENKAFDVQAARADLGFNPRSFPAGVQAQAKLMGLT